MDDAITDESSSASGDPLRAASGYRYHSLLGGSQRQRRQYEPSWMKRRRGPTCGDVRMRCTVPTGWGRRYILTARAAGMAT